MSARTRSSNFRGVACGAAGLLIAGLAFAAGQVQTGSAQVRTFDAADRNQVVRAAMATLQDLGFVIEKADAAAGSFTAAKIERDPLRITVTAQAKDERRVTVQALATYEDAPVADARPYQAFFAALGTALPATSHSAD